MKKDLSYIGGLFLIIVALLVFGKGFTSAGLVSGKNSASSSSSAGIAKSVKIKDFVVNVDVADTNEKRQKGLSNMDGMPIDRGMLFIFDKSDFYTMWMKDMRFAIDIIWIGEDKKVVYIAQNVASEPNKKDSELTRYTSSGAARYVLEVNAGLTSLNQVAIGDLVEF